MIIDISVISYGLLSVVYLGLDLKSIQKFQLVQNAAVETYYMCSMICTLGFCCMSFIGCQFVPGSILGVGNS